MPHSMKAPRHPSEKMINVVGRLMKKRNVFAKYAAIEGQGREKAWREAGIHNVMSFLLERRIFDNALDTRKGTQLFLFKTSQIMENKSIPVAERKNVLHEETRFYLESLMKHNKVVDKVQFAERFVLTLKLAQERLDHCMDEIHRISRLEKTNNAGLTKLSHEEVELAKLAAHDGYAHLSMSLYSLVFEMPEVIHAAEKLREEYKKN